ncbi:MAG: T9SS type A sorting domain-containing protein [Bacteroidota bacterium]|nr:T9SS type A sorting domain-containing protein [Bacteroidota bacterium]
MKRNILKGLTLGVLTTATVLVGYTQERTTLFGRELSPEYVVPGTNIVRCGTHQHAELQGIEFAGVKAPDIVEGTYVENNDVYVIPVVVHVIHSGQAVGTGRNVSDARVHSQIKVLNEDFRKEANTPGYGQGVDTHIEFCLVKTDPEGNPTTGINRVNMGNMQWNRNNIETTLKPQTQWDPTRYFNIWVVQFAGDAEGLLGYAQFPEGSTLLGIPASGSANTDGVVINWSAFGRRSESPGSYMPTYDKGRTATHEVGHCLGLRHIWGDNASCTVNALDTMQDFCPDTPAAAAANHECPPGLDSCPAAPGLDMTWNYMDYGGDNCLNTFTNNQRTRMRTTLQNAQRRASLITPSNLDQVCGGVSVDDFKFGNISIFPNPANDVLNIVVPDNQSITGKLVVYNAVGQQVYTTQVSQINHHAIDVSNFAKGAYFVKIENQGSVKTVQFIKK